MDYLKFLMSYEIQLYSQTISFPVNKAALEFNFAKLKNHNIMRKCSTLTSSPFYNIKKEFDVNMEIISVYLIIGVLISTSIYAVADFRPWNFFSALCIVWLPLLFIGIIINLFMDIEEISNKLNK